MVSADFRRHHVLRGRGWESAEFFGAENGRAVSALFFYVERWSARLQLPLPEGFCEESTKDSVVNKSASFGRTEEHEDNLGEELISICVNILSHLPGVSDGKLCVLTDDKGAAGRIDSVMRRTGGRNQGSRIVLFSTPKLVQHMFLEHAALSENNMVKLISQGASGNIVVMGITAFDLKVDEKISMSCRALVKKIMEPNGIKIVF